MKIILIKDFPKLGKRGEVVEVKDGYARNYLIPQGFALKATRENFKRWEEIKRREEKRFQKKKEEALKLKEKIEGISVTITSQVKDDEEIYGSISEIDICKALRNEGIEIDKKQIIIKEPIKKIGVYKVDVDLHPEVCASLRVWVVKK